MEGMDKDNRKMADIRKIVVFLLDFFIYSLIL